MKKVRLGIIGAGAIAENAHINNYKTINNVEVVAVSDINYERATEIANKFEISSIYSDELELLDRTDIDAVSICTPNYLHARQAILAMEKGKHVLLEKPMCLNLLEADQIMEKAEETGKILMVGFTHRFFELNQYVKKQLDSGTIGKVLNARVRFAHRGPYESWFAKSDWFFDKDLSGGGALLDMGIHALDLLRYFVGEFASIKGHTARLLHNIDTEDFASALIEFENGAYGQMETGWYSQDGFTGYEIYGTNGTIICDYQSVRILKEVENEMQWIVRPAGHDGWSEEMRFFIEAIQTGNLKHSSVEDGKKSLELALELYSEVTNVANQ